MAKTDYYRTSESANRVVDANLKVSGAFFLPNADEGADLGDNDQGPAIDHKDGRMRLHVDGVWKEIAFVGEVGNGGNTQNKSVTTFINQTDQSLIDVTVITNEVGDLSFNLSKSAQTTGGINSLPTINSSNNKPVLITVITADNGDFTLKITEQ